MARVSKADRVRARDYLRSDFGKRQREALETGTASERAAQVRREKGMRARRMVSKNPTSSCDHGCVSHIKAGPKKSQRESATGYK